MAVPKKQLASTYFLPLSADSPTDPGKLLGPQFSAYLLIPVKAVTSIKRMLPVEHPLESFSIKC